MEHIIYQKYNWERYKIPKNDYNRWMIDMLVNIWTNEWWEETQDDYFDKHFGFIAERDLNNN